MSNVQLVRYKKGKHSFEIMTKPGSVRLFLSGKLGWDKVLSAEAIFTNAKKGNIAREQDLQEVFRTCDINKCAEIMVREGEAQVSASERKEDIDTHCRAIIAYLHRSFTDQTNTRYPISKLELVMEEAKIRVDPAISVHKQAEEVIKRMQGKMVFKKGTTDYTITVSKAYAKKCGVIICKYSPAMHKEQRNPDGITWKICLALGDMENFTNEMNKITEGDFTMVSGHE
jgi:rRNA metabolism SBDS family protein